MNARVSLESAVLRNLRAHGPRLLGARRHVHRDLRGRQTPYLELGSAVDGTLVFLHGFSDRPEHFLGTAALLARRYRILAPAMPCFGEGFVDREADHGFETFGAWLTEIVEGIAPGRFHLMGNSLGGAAALGIASRMPERLASLTLVDTAGVKPRGVSCVFDDFENGANPFEVRTREDYDAFVRTVASKPSPVLGLLGNALFEEARSNVDWYGRLGKELGASVRRFYERGQDSFVDLASIAVPTLVVWGEHDALFPSAIGERIAATMPDARFELFRGVGHCPHLEAPNALARSFRRFASERV